MPERRFYTFVLRSHVGSRVRRFSLPHSIVVALAVIGGVAVAASGVAAYHYTCMVIKVADYHHLLSENNAFRAENQNYRIQTAQLGEKIDALETLSRRLRIVSGLDKIGGQGGVSPESLAKPVSPAAGTLAAIDRYNREVNELDERLRAVRDSLYDSALVAAAQPAFLPVKGYVTNGLGKREDPFTGSSERHTGIDISAPYGSRVSAPADGTVVYAGIRAGYGNIVVIDHKFGVTTRYGHLWKLNVEAGQHVSRSDVIGYVGTTGRTTGPHLHFELWVHGRSVDPLRYMREVNRGGSRQTAAKLP
jgi:murein DD-endopeptidase MepM/ murein hydrolase activator NlpD